MAPSRAAQSEARGPDADRPPARSWVFFFAAIVVLTVAMAAVSFPVGLYTVFGTRLSNSTHPVTSSTPVRGIALDLVVTTVAVPLGGNLGEVFAVVTAIYLAFFLLTARQGAGLSKALRDSATGNYNALFSNPLAAMLVLLGATTFVTFLIDTLQTSAGVATGALTGDPFSLLLSFTVAPLLEEFTFRVIMIGVPVLLLALVVLRGSSPGAAARALWRPSSLWDVDEEGEGSKRRTFGEATPSMFPDRPYDSFKVKAVKPVVYVFLVFSSMVFGYAHYASGAGWGPGKISEAALAGFALGYLYIKYGFAADVMMHWSVNYVGSVFSFFAQAVWGVPWTSSTGNPLDIVPSAVIVFLLGAPSTYIVVADLLRRSSNKAPLAPAKAPP